MLKVGITGGIGSGKTTVCKIFETLGVPVYYSDLEARYLTNSHPEIISAVKELFGEEIYINGELNRARVGSLVFKDKELLNKLNQIIHPKVAEHYQLWNMKNKRKHFTLKEAAILFESGGYKEMDYIISVTAPVDLRVQRVVGRDGLQAEEVLQRLNNQMTDVERNKKSDYIVVCDDVNLVIPQVVDLYNRILEK